MAYETTPTTDAWPADLGWGMGALGGTGLDWRNRAIDLLRKYEDLKFQALFIRNYQVAENLIANLGPAGTDGTTENRANHVLHNISETQGIVNDLKNNPEALDTALDSYYLAKGYRTGRITRLNDQVKAFKDKVEAAATQYGTDKVAKISKSPYLSVRIRNIENAVALPSDTQRDRETPVPAVPLTRRPGFWVAMGGLTLVGIFSLSKLVK
jgi:hypothetical protein